MQANRCDILLGNNDECKHDVTGRKQHFAGAALWQQYGSSGPAPHTLVFPVPVRWQPVTSDVPIALQVAKVVPFPSPQAVAARSSVMLQQPCRAWQELTKERSPENNQPGTAIAANNRLKPNLVFEDMALKRKQRLIKLVQTCQTRWPRVKVGHPRAREHSCRSRTMQLSRREFVTANLLHTHWCFRCQ